MAARTVCWMSVERDEPQACVVCGVELSREAWRGQGVVWAGVGRGGVAACVGHFRDRGDCKFGQALPALMRGLMDVVDDGA